MHLRGDLGLAEEEKGDQKEEGKKDCRRPRHVAKETRHFPSGVFGNGADHEVRCVPDISNGPEEYRTRADSQKKSFRHSHVRSTQVQALRQCGEAVGGVLGQGFAGFARPQAFGVGECPFKFLPGFGFG